VIAESTAAVSSGKKVYYMDSAVSSHLHESLVDSLSVGVIFADRAGILTCMNKKAETILDVDRKSVLGKRIDMLPLKTPVYKIMSENSRELPLEMNILGRGIMVRSMEVKSRNGKVMGQITELQDVTDEKKEKRQKEEFVAMMTHDLKSPLMVMLGHVQALKLGMCGDIDSQIRSSIAEIERSGVNLCSMIENVLDIYRLETGLVQIKSKLSDIVAILQKCFLNGKVYAEDKEIEMELSVPEKIPPIFADDRQLARVFNNLLENAIKFTPAKGKISVSAIVNENLLQVSFQDTGIGIASKDLPMIFNKYYRSEKASGFKGTGLGLTISMAITEAHGGVIEVESIEEMGSIFTVKIPLRSCTPGNDEPCFAALRPS
jgi:signal transduction histidine kinase